MECSTFPEKTESYHGYVLHRFHFDGCECMVVEPHTPRPGREWIWKAEFFEAFPTFELAMLERGFYLVFITVGNTFGCPDALKHWDAFYRELTGRHGFARRTILFGLSRGGALHLQLECAEHGQGLVPLRGQSGLRLQKLAGRQRRRSRQPGGLA